MPSSPRACVIGAGSSGIVAAKALADRGIAFDWFEASDRVGGNWAFGNPNGMSAAYEHLYLNSSKTRTQFADLPMPAGYPDFPHHTQVLAYLESFVDRFGLRDRIRFRTPVTHAAPLAGGGFAVTTGGEEQHYDALLVANGHHWDARWPEPAIPGDLDGEVIHAHDYRTTEQLRDRRVVILGMGNSAMDIAVAASYAAVTTTVAMRRSAHVIPKYLFGRPLDTLVTQANVPFRLKQLTSSALLGLARGRVERYGLPKPDHRLLEAHPTVSDDFLSRVGHGAIGIKPMIRRLAGDRVEFADDTTAAADLVIYATGYRITFPFFDEGFVSAPGNVIALWHNFVDPGRPGLYFIGLLQPLGSVLPLAEAQAKLVAAHLAGAVTFPDATTMRQDIAHTQAALRKRYVASPRHTIQVDFDDELHALHRLLRD